MNEKSKHVKTSDLSRGLCDLMLASLPKDSAPSRNFTPTWCGVHIQQRDAALCWVLHSKKHIQVFLRCEDTPEIRSQIKERLPEGVPLEARPYPRAANWAMSTPLFLFIRTEQQARDMGPLLNLLSTYRPKSPGSTKSSANKVWRSPSEAREVEDSAAEEGTRVSILVNRYERSRVNRERCIKAYGAWCRVCGFDFSSTFGEIGKGYIHVHHSTKLAALKGKAQKFDPVKDMIPVCPNCHEMLHRKDPPYTIDQLKEIIASLHGHGNESTHP